MAGELLTVIELRNAAKAAAIQINELGKAHGKLAATNPTLVRLVLAISAYDKAHPLPPPPQETK
jgi:hypothetical protein